MTKLALLSMDIEDWYHLDYFPRPETVEWSMLDGVDRFSEFLGCSAIPATFFCLGELAGNLKGRLEQLLAAGHEIASHGPDHQLPSRQDHHTFREDMRRHKAALEDAIGGPVRGYRAPCFAIDRPKLDILADLGFGYDSSFVDFPAHPLYGRMDLSDWEVLPSGVRRAPGGTLLEFEIPVSTVLGRPVPVAGGAYFRVFPWALSRALLQKVLHGMDIYVFYIHPFECSSLDAGPLPSGTDWRTRFRFSIGRERVMPRLDRLVHLLRINGFEFATFSQAVETL